MLSDQAVTGVPSFANRLPEKVRWALFNDAGYRAGCRLAMFALLFFFFTGLLRAVQFTLLLRVFHIHLPKPISGSEVMPWMFILIEGHRFIAFMIASSIMSRFEHRSMGTYGLPLDRLTWKRLLEGLSWGFGGITLVLCIMRLFGAFEFGAPAMHGSSLWTYAGWWSLAFLCVALFEEFQFRGYSFRTGTEAIGFWPTALISSAWFAIAHMDNGGETKAGILSVLVFGVCFCWIVKRTGSLWIPVGFHFAWDMGQSFVFGVPDSGSVSYGRLLAPVFHGSEWLTGGTVGPEGSILAFLFLAVMAWVITIRFGKPGIDKVVQSAHSTDLPVDATNSASAI